MKLLFGLLLLGSILGCNESYEQWERDAYSSELSNRVTAWESLAGGDESLTVEQGVSILDGDISDMRHTDKIEHTSMTSVIGDLHELQYFEKPVRLSTRDWFELTDLADRIHKYRPKPKVKPKNSKLVELPDDDPPAELTMADVNRTCVLLHKAFQF